jgi:hypothetical protein
MSQNTKIKNAHDHRTYWVSTLRNPAGVWETAIREAGFLGLPSGEILCGASLLTREQTSQLGQDAGLLTVRGVLFIPVKAISISKEDINWIHAKIADIARDYPKDKWQGMIANVVPEYLRGQGLLQDDIGGDTPKDDRAIESIPSILEESLRERAGILAQALIMWADAAKDLFRESGKAPGRAWRGHPRARCFYGGAVARRTVAIAAFMTMAPSSIKTSYVLTPAMRPSTTPPVTRQTRTVFPTSSPR